MRRAFSRSGETIAALFLFAAAALLMCGVVAFGAEGYAAVRGSAATDAQTAAEYVATKVRSAERVEARGDRLVLSETADGEEYLCEIYLYGGSLCELYHAASVELSDDAGLELLPADRFSAESDGAVLSVEIENGGERATVELSPRCGLEQGEGGR